MPATADRRWTWPTCEPRACARYGWFATSATHDAVLNVDAFDDAVPVPSLRPPHGLHGLWHHRRIRPTELAGEANKRELNRSAVEPIALELPC